MLTALLILLATAALCAALSTQQWWVGVARWPAVLGVASALGTSFLRESPLDVSGAASVVPWPGALQWLGEPLYRGDSLSAGLGAWCLLLGLLFLLKMSFDEGESAGEAASHLACAVLLLAVLYSLAHTDNLLWYAGQLLLIVPLVPVLQAASGRDLPGYNRCLAALGLGATFMLGAALLMGRTMGDVYSLSTLSISALTLWPLLLMGGFVLLWLGMSPVTGWSSRLPGGNPVTSALMQSLAIGVPVVSLLLRLQGLVSAQAWAGTGPGGWTAFMTVLAWLGGVGSLVAAAGLLVWAGSTRWTGLLTAYTMSLMLWAVCQDDPMGRVAGLAILLAYGAGRAVLELCGGGNLDLRGVGRAAAIASLCFAPLAPAFVGLWLLATDLAGAKHPGLAILLVGSAIVAACGIVLHYAGFGVAVGKMARLHPAFEWLGVVLAGCLVVGGALPQLWVPFVTGMARVAGGVAAIALPWEGLGAGGLVVPLFMLALSGLLFGLAGWAFSAWARRSANTGGVLLPSGLDRLQRTDEATQTVGGWHSEGAARLLLANPPAFIWWLSLSWLEAGIWGFSLLLGKIGTRSGALLRRVEGRYYLPLVMGMIVLALFLASR